MNDARPPDRNVQARIGKQIMLPWGKAVEIAMKSIRVRFWRSMITMSSIILAIAFLMSIWTATAITAALALGPQRRIEVLKVKLSIVRDAIAAAPATVPKDYAEQLYPADLAVAARRVRTSIVDIQKAMKTAPSDEKKKLASDVEKLQAALDPAKSLLLLRDYLMDERHELERVKGEVDTILQQERSGGEAEPQEGAPPAPAAKPAQAAVGGFVTDFLRHMSPTDKWLAVLALLVCFVGIVNAMFMTVQERFREIGTMKCLGALDAFIVKIFLIESATLGFIGTLFGILIGLLLSAIRQFVVYGKPVISYFPPLNILVAALMAAIVGLLLSVVAAIFPARRAARMEPVEAMRIEE